VAHQNSDFWGKVEGGIRRGVTLSYLSRVTLSWAVEAVKTSCYNPNVVSIHPNIISRRLENRVPGIALSVVLSIGIGLILSGCSSAPLVVKPSPATVPNISGFRQQFVANQAVSWSVVEPNGGGISADGIYTPATTAGTYTIRATTKNNTVQDVAVTVVSGGSGSSVSFEQLKQGGYVIFLRHFDADVGQDRVELTQPEWWRSPDPAVARQLNTQGRNRAVKVGENFRQANIPIAEVISSDFYRCEESANLMRLGVLPQLSRSLNYLFHSNEQNNMLAMFSKAPQPKHNTLLVGQGATLPITNSLQWGDAVVFEPFSLAGATSTSNLTQFIGYIRINELLNPPMPSTQGVFYDQNP
jgi:phosphohistidine phosphatase SixA